MSQILIRLQEFLRRYSNKLRMFLNRQNIFLVNETSLLINETLTNNPGSKCFFCNREITIDNLEGWFFDNTNSIHFFCNDPVCKGKAS